MRFKNSALVLSLVLFSSVLTINNVEARTFRNAYIAFEMKDGWRCVQESSEYVCRSEDPVESKEAIIILTAKERGPDDKFELYYNHMKTPMKLLHKNGTTSLSKVEIPPTERVIANQKWLDALHSNSEIQNYYTRYLATVKDQIAILVTFSVYVPKYSEYATQFMQTIGSLKVVATKDLTAQTSSGSLHGSNESLGAGIGSAIPADLLTGDDVAPLSKRKSGGLAGNMVTILIALLIAIAGYIGFRIYKNK